MAQTTRTQIQNNFSVTINKREGATNADGPETELYKLNVWDQIRQKPCY